MDKITPKNVCDSNYRKDYFNITNLQRKLENSISTVKFMQSCQDDLIIPNTFKDIRNVEALNGDEKEAWKTKEQEMTMVG